MSDSGSLNSTDYVYEVKSRGKFLFLRSLMISFYILFIIAFFLICYITRIIPLFAIAPMILYIIFLFTWQLVKYDVYWSFERGTLEVGKVKRKRREMRRIALCSIHIKDAVEIAPFENSAQLSGIKRIYNISESPDSIERIIIVFLEKGIKSCAIVEGTARLGALLSSFSKNAHGIKDRKFHG